MHFTRNSQMAALGIAFAFLAGVCSAQASSEHLQQIKVEISHRSYWTISILSFPAPFDVT
jgi:hypothetical protein